MSNRDPYPPPASADRSPDLSSADELLLRQVREALTPMPTVDRRAIANILAAVADRRPTPLARLGSWMAFSVDRFRYATSPLTRVSAIAASCMVVGFVARGLILRDTPLDAPTSSSTFAQSATARDTPTSGDAPSALPSTIVTRTVSDTADPMSSLVSVQFVLDARLAANATSVSVVGDFNEWNVAATPMTLERGAWNVSLPTTQGRHVYAFVINGERWIADPRAPRATDTDFGRPGSVIIVQMP